MIRRNSLAAGALATFASVLMAVRPATAAPPSAWPWQTAGAQVTAAAPAPDDTIAVTGTEPYLGVPATGRAFVYLAPGHTQLAIPIVVPRASTSTTR